MTTEYVIICTDQLSDENSFLFWKAGARGYTSDVNKAGIWTTIPKNLRDFAIEKCKLLEQFEPRAIVGNSLFELMHLIKQNHNGG